MDANAGLGKRKTVLVVDDNADTAEVVSLLLESLGHRALGISDSKVAVSACRDLRPDVVFLDLGMPGLDGYAVCRAIRELMPQAPKVIAMTGWSGEGRREAAGDAGFDDYLLKPFSVAALSRAMAECTENGSPKAANHRLA